MKLWKKGRKKAQNNRIKNKNKKVVVVPRMAQRQVDRLTRFEQLLVSPDEGLFKSRNLLLLNLSIFLIFNFSSK
jgi:hypothetical protein